MIFKLKIQAPNIALTAKLGAPTRVTALIPLANSGIEVTVAINKKPTQFPPKPVLSAIASP